MTTEYNRGFRDCIHAARVIIRRICQKRIPVRSTDILEAVLNAIVASESPMYNKGVEAGIANIQEILGPAFLPLYTGDLYELLPRLVINPPS